MTDERERLREALDRVPDAEALLDAVRAYGDARADVAYGRTTRKAIDLAWDRLLVAARVPPMDQRGSNGPEETAWLIERGQPEGQVPTVWWADRKRDGLMDVDKWTQDAFKAERFETREEAEEVIARKFSPPASRGGSSARAVEHGFIGSIDPEPS
jgi:hypothetical protein